MGDMDGSKPGKSCAVFRGAGGVYIATDHASPDEPAINILNLLNRSVGNWKETFLEAKKICGIYDVKAVKEVVRPPVPSTKEIAPMRGTEAFRYLREDRGLKESTLKHYQIRSHKRFSRTGNTDFWAVQFHDHTGQLVMVKSTGTKKVDGKKDIWSSPPYATLWGWSLTDDHTKSVIITEGEIDAMSIHQMGPDMPVLSVPSGASNMGWIENDFEALERFEWIYLAFDNDPAGEDACRKVAKRLGLMRCKRIKIPDEWNDANDMLLDEGKCPAIKELLKNASTYDPKQLKGVVDLGWDLDQEINRYEEEKSSNPFMWAELPFRFRLGECGVVTGYPGHGKSQWLYQATLHEMLANNRRACVASFEIPAKSMLFNMVWQDLGKAPTKGAYDASLDKLAGKLWFIEGEEGGANSWQMLKEDFLYAHKRFGCDLFVIDALMHISNKDDYSGQEKIAKQAAKFSVENDVSVVLVCHADAKKAGSGHLAEPEDILGGQGIAAAAGWIVSIWRNKEKEKKVEAGEDGAHLEPDGKFYIPKQRANGITVYRDIWYDRMYKTFALERREPLIEENEPDFDF